MINAEGIKAFTGIMRIIPKAEWVKPFELKGSWVYKADTKCWYGKGSSFPEEICEFVEEFVE